MNHREKEFYELFGQALEELGATRMVGRVLALLMVGEKQEYTMGEIIDQIGTAKSAVSLTLKQLTQSTMVEKFRKPGQRADHYRMKENAWSVFGNGVTRKFQKLIDLTDQGLELLEGLPPKRLERLEQMGEMYRFFLDQWPKLNQAWEEYKKDQDPNQTPN